MGTTATARGLAEPRERWPERGRPATDQREPQERGTARDERRQRARARSAGGKHRC